MYLSQKEMLWCRDASESHKNPIRFRPLVKQNLGNDITSYLATVFRSHLPSHFLSPKHLEEGACQTINGMTENELAYYFYKSFCCKVKFNTGITGEIVGADEILDEVYGSEPFIPATGIVFITGEVGSGKSTAMCKLLYDSSALALTNRRCVTRVDIDLHIDRKEDESLFAFDKEDLCQWIFEAVLENVRIAFDPFISDAFLAGLLDREMSNPLDKLSALIWFLSEQHCISSTIFIDNIDLIIYQLDRYLFSEVDKANRTEILEKLRSYLSLFTDKRYSGIYGFKVVFAAREESLKWLKNAFLDQVSQEIIIYGIEPLDPHQVLMAYTKYFEYLLDRTNAPRKEKAKKLAQGLIDALEKPKNLRFKSVNWAYYLSSNGLRGTVSSAPTLLLPLNECDFDEISERISHQFHPLPLLTILNQKRMFSQTGSRFPDLFLIRGDIRQKDYDYVGDHRFTYWLKVLILKYIKCKSYNEEMCTILDIVNTFSPKEEPNKNMKYKEELVRLCVGSMFSSDGSGLLSTIESNVTHQVLHLEGWSLKLTQRARMLLGSIDNRHLEIGDNLYYDFIYLQLIIDDWALPIPVSLRDSFALPKVDGMIVDYNYIVEPTYTYRRLRDAMVASKYEMCRIFLKILRIAFAEEEKQNPKTFGYLRRMYAIPEDDSCLVDAVDGLDRTAAHLLNNYRDLVNQIVERTESMSTYIEASVRDLYEAIPK